MKTIEEEVKKIKNEKIISEGLAFEFLPGNDAVHTCEITFIDGTLKSVGINHYFPQGVLCEVYEEKPENEDAFQTGFMFIPYYQIKFIFEKNRT